LNRSCLLFVLLVMSLLAYTPARAIAAPKIELKDRVFNFGEVIEGQTVEHTFRVENRGDQPLEIQQLKPT
jgi:Protein of unknown function (DUF1573)